jgi:hypothetical protein
MRYSQGKTLFLSKVQVKKVSNVDPNFPVQLEAVLRYPSLAAYSAVPVAQAEKLKVDSLDIAKLGFP